MKVETPQAFGFILQDEIYLLESDRSSISHPANTPSPISSPEKEPATIAPIEVETPQVVFKYMGSNQKHFLILVDYTNEEFIAAPHLAALENILKRKDLAVADVAILNVNHYKPVTLESINQQLRPAKMLVLGKNAMPGDVTSLTLNQPAKIGSIDALYSFSFEEMMENNDRKKGVLGSNEIALSMKQLVFATNNRHKLEEVSAKITGQIEVLRLDDIGCSDNIEETGSTFNENASIKSSFIYQKYKLNCFGDDSGLEIDALDGEPGIYSARYAGVHGDHDANINKVLEKLNGQDNRRARFRTVISLIWEGVEYFFEGTVEGTIRQKRSGTKGFGYDPIFEPEGYDITFAEMSMDEKNRISHRAKAMEKLITFLNAQ